MENALRGWGWGSKIKSMKTTVELPDAVLVRAKTVAIARKTTLRQLILNGLLRELQSPSAEDGEDGKDGKDGKYMHPVESLRVLESDLWADVKADQYVESQRQNWL